MASPKCRVGALVVWMMAIGAAPGAAQSPQPASVARVITGTVVDERDRGIGGALIAVVGSTLRTAATGLAAFGLENAPDGEVTLRITAIGYRPITQAVSPGATGVGSSWNASAINLEELVVTGTAVAAQKREIGNSVASINADEFQEFAPARDLTNLLNGKAPGVSVVPAPARWAAGPASPSAVRARCH